MNLDEAIKDGMERVKTPRVYEHDYYGRITLVGVGFFGQPYYQDAKGDIKEYEEEALPNGEDFQRGKMRLIK